MKRKKRDLQKVKIKIRKIVIFFFLLAFIPVDWSLGQWWKKAKVNASPPSTKDNSFTGSETNISKNNLKKFEKFGNYAKNFIKDIANNVQSQLMEPGALGDPLWGDFPTANKNKEEQKTGGKPIQKAEEGIIFT